MYRCVYICVNIYTSSKGPSSNKWVHQKKTIKYEQIHMQYENRPMPMHHEKMKKGKKKEPYTM